MKYLSVLLIAMFAIVIFTWAWPLILVLFLVISIGSSILNRKIRQNASMYQQDENQDYSTPQDQPFERFDANSSEFEERVEHPEVIDAEFTERDTNGHA